jgi:hypothetical protein
MKKQTILNRYFLLLEVKWITYTTGTSATTPRSATPRLPAKAVLTKRCLQNLLNPFQLQLQSGNNNSSSSNNKVRKFI